jgi:hypothetical protein
LSGKSFSQKQTFGHRALVDYVLSERDENWDYVLFQVGGNWGYVLFDQYQNRENSVIFDRFMAVLDAVCIESEVPGLPGIPG